MVYINQNHYSIFNDEGQRIEKSFTFDDNANAYGSCFTMLNGEALIFGGYLHPKTIQRQVTNSNQRFSHLLIFKISVVSGCELRRLGDLPFDFIRGTCGTFMINDQPTILLCFDSDNRKRCRSLIRKNEIALRNINNFTFDGEFDLDTINIPNSLYNHGGGKLANYQGYPLILGDMDNVKLEMLVTTELPIEWNEQTDYPFTDT